MSKFRCKFCNRLLFLGLFKGKIEIKCNKCKKSE
ncbi:gpCom control of modification [Bacillus phage Staley]|uniref:Com family DNA-binding transcriptional regulator n=1 Tax=Bacillus phage Staley TaxID=1406792 RepID=U5PXZ3_9CAUD|nr:gpCom control of modification [Bacillus phage Staley]AGY48789.1 hypothetical protein Staley_106 [Bacillus phage Staley]